ncbi:MAG: transposase [Thermomicrobiales bacterium]|nr:transposase [Thermomicrobiales bacterium]
MDNLSVHRNAAARVAVEAARCRFVFLPPYSPDFNPIELGFAKLKAWLRGVGLDLIRWQRRSVRVSTGLRQPMQAFFRHCGYHDPP